MALRFSRALASGRSQHRQMPVSRESLLVTLLNKRAVAHNVGANDLEEMLRSQILWSLPTYRTADLEQLAA